MSCCALHVTRTAFRWLGALLLAPMAVTAQRPGDCATSSDTVRSGGPSIALDVDPGVRYMVGDSVRIGLALNQAPAGEKIAFVVNGMDRVRLDEGNVIRWRAVRGNEGFNFITVAARQGETTLACRQVRLTVERTQRAPIVRLSSRQVQAGTLLDMQVSAFDPDGDSLSYTISDMPLNVPPPMLDSTGRFRWRAPLSGSNGGVPYQFKIEVSDGFSISAAILSVTVSGQNVRPECPLTYTNVTANEGSEVLLPMAATDPNGDALRFRAERELVNGRVDSTGYRWDIPYGTVETGASDRTFDFQWRALDTQQLQSDLCTTRVTVRARMHPDRLRVEQESHARFYTNAELTIQDLDTRLEELRDKINANDNGRRRRSIAALATALLAGTFQLARAEDTRRLAGGINTLTSVFFAGFNALAPGTDGLKSEARKFEDEISRYSPLVTAFRITYGESVSEQVLRTAQYRTDRAALEAEQARAAALMR